MSATVAEPLTIEEFVALPDEAGVDRMLLFGELVERPMTMRNHRHAEAEASIVAVLKSWRNARQTARGKVYSGEVGCRLPQVESSFGIDVAYFDQETLDRQEPDARYLIGPPVLAVEILSPSDTVDDLHRKIRAYLESGVKLVWIVDPQLQTITVHRPDARPELFAGDQQISGEPHLPGLAFPVQSLFE